MLPVRQWPHHDSLGCGITIDSSSHDEYQESLDKLRFLTSKCLFTLQRNNSTNDLSVAIFAMNVYSVLLLSASNPIALYSSEALFNHMMYNFFYFITTNDNTYAPHCFTNQPLYLPFGRDVS